MQLAFWILSFIAVFAAVMVILSDRPIVSGLYLLLSFVAVAGIYITLSAPFIAAMQLVVYSGAIIVLFLFVLMLLNQHKELPSTRSKFVTFVSVCTAILIGVVFYLSVLKSKIILSYTEMSKVGGMRNNVETIAEVMFSKYFIPFELVSILLLAAMIAAVFLSKKRV